jgi:polysaccharide biosynthesis transport protein
LRIFAVILLWVDALGEGQQQGTARYVQALRQHWPYILISMVLAVAAAVAYSAVAEKRYEAEADVLVTPIPGGDETFIGIPVIRESEQGRSVLTAARLAKTPQVADAVRTKLRLDISRDRLLDLVVVTPQEQSNIVTITGQSSTPEGAARIANGFAREMIAQRTALFQRELQGVVRRLSRRLEELAPERRGSAEAAALADRLGDLRGLIGARDPTLQLSSLAVAPTSAAWPKPQLSIAVALLAGLLLGMGIAVMLELVNPLVVREEDLLEQRLPVLARVPRMRKTATRATLAGRESLPGEVGEAYRTLRMNLAGAGPDRGMPRTILVTSAVGGEGKTMTAVNLATTIALAGTRVVLVDADLRDPAIGAAFRLPAPSVGFADVLLGEAKSREALVPAPRTQDRLQLLLSRSADGYLIDFLQTHRVERVISELAKDADVIIFDSPPVTEVADSLALADAVDAVLVVVRFGRTRRDKLTELRRILAQRGVSPVGVVAITRKRPRSDYGRSAEGRAATPEPRGKPALVPAKAKSDEG